MFSPSRSVRPSEIWPSVLQSNSAIDTPYAHSNLSIVVSTPLTHPLFFPKFTYNITQVMSISIAINAFTNQPIGNSPFDATSVGPANYTGIAPDLGPKTGGTILTVAGTNFTDSAFMQVRVGGVPCTTTTFVTSTQVLCTTPSTASTSLAVDVSNNKVDYSQAHTQVAFYNTETVGTFDPQNGPVYGRTKVTVIGSNFLNSPYLQCKFGSVIATVQPTFESATKIICESPANEVGDLTLGVANNGQQFVNSANKFRYIEPYSPLCRLPTELSVGVPERISKNQPYLENIALNASTNGTSDGSDVNNPSQLVDGDRCCLKTVTNQGLYCGMKFPEQVTNTSDILKQVVITLPRQAFVNEFISAWFQPCRNQPDYYLMEYSTNADQNWQTLFTRVTRVSGTEFGVQKPCFFVPSDQLDASICIDFLSSEIRATQFRMRFNNSAGRMGTFGASTDGAWLYEFEVHGVFTDIPEFLNFVTDLSAFPAQRAVSSISLPPVAIRTLNHQKEILLAADTTTTQISVSLKRGGGLSDAQQYLGGTTTVNMAGGIANFTDLTLNAPVADVYTLMFTSNTGLIANTTMTVTIGPEHELRLVTTATYTLQSQETVVVSPAVNLKLFDVSNSFVGALAAPRFVNVTQLTGPSTLSFVTATARNMSDSDLTIGDLGVSKPIPGVYVLSVGSTGLPSINITVTITSGVPHSVQLINSLTNSQFGTAAQTAISDINIRIVDISGTATALGSGSTAVTATSLNGSEPLINSVRCTVTGSTCTLTGIKMSAPLPGTYVLAITSPGLVNTTTSLQIIIGAPVELRVRNLQAFSYPSIASVAVDNLILDAYDASGTFVSDKDVATRSVSITSLNGTTLTIQGTTGYTTKNGTVTIDNMQFLSPVVGTYVLRFSTSGLSSIDVQYFITVGPAAKLELFSPQSVNIETVPTAALPAITIRALDSGRFFVDSSDTTNRTVYASVDGQTFLSSQGSVGSMLNGSVVFSNLKFNAPKRGQYTLRFQSANLTQVTLNVTITSGPPATITVSPTHLTDVVSQAVVTLGTVTIKVLDAGGDLVTDSRVINKTLSLAHINSTDIVLSGQLNKTMTGATETMNQIQMLKPSTGVFRLTFTVSGVTSNASTLVTVLVGAPFQLALVSPAASTKPTQPTVSLDSISVKVLDIAGTFVAGANGIIMSVNTTNPSSFDPQGQTVSTINNGVGTFSGLTVTRPRNGTYTLNIFSTGITSQSVQIIVSPGFPYRLTSTQSSFGPLPSVTQITVTAFDIVVLDASDNRVPTQYADTRTVSASVIQKPTASLAQNAVGGTLTRQLANVSFAKFDNVTLTTPPIGNYILQFSSNGLLSTNINITVVIGPAVEWRLDQPQGTISIQSTVQSNIPSISLKAFDAGGSFVGTTDTNARQVTVSLLQNNPETPAFVGTMVRNSSFGAVQFTDLGLVRPKNQTFTLEFSAAGLKNATKAVTVGIGPSLSLIHTKDSTATLPSVASVSIPQIFVQTVDAGGTVTTLGNGGKNVSVSVNDTSVVFGGTDTLPIVGSHVSFRDLVFSAPKTGAYQLSFTSPGLVATSTVVTIVVGPGHKLVLPQGAPNVLSLQTVTTTPIPTITLALQDIGDNLVTTSDVTQRTVFAQLLTSGSTMSGSQFSNMTFGQSQYSDLALAAPPAGDYVVQFSSIGLQEVTVTLRVSIGPAVRLVVQGNAFATVESKLTSIIPSFDLVAVDAAGASVLATDNQNRSISIWTPSLALQGPSSFVMTNGSVRIFGLTASRPSHGSNLLHVSTPGLTNATFNATIVLGPAIEQIVNSAQNTSYQSQSQLALDPVVVKAKEASGELVGTKDTQSRKVQVFCNTLNLINGSTAMMSNGVVTLNLVAKEARQGFHRLLIATAGLTNTSVDVIVTQGLPVRIIADTYDISPHPSDDNVQLRPVTVHFRDAGGDVTVLTQGTLVSISSVDTPTVSISGNLTVNATGSSATLSQVWIHRPKASDGKYTLRLTSAGIASTSIDVFVRVGPPRSMITSITKIEKYGSAVTVNLKQLVVTAVDAAGEPVGDTDVANNPRTVSVVKQNASFPFNVGGPTAMVNGSLVLNAMSVSSPTVGVYCKCRWERVDGNRGWLG
eukprot:TRINITY_DN426_c1_g1_i15.p1 TRINITY_DN426_c1_g1~~TRINITY_DN426_c1_g1_i15.p1  ORF type:complete len:2104 (-),score=545.44 TRINITY_DN426_c1_g1_i15:2947-9258(-)